MGVTLISPVLVGREAELAVLTGAVERAAAGDAAVVIVGGEAGVGKTRLVEEVAKRARSARVLSGACVEIGGDALPLAPLVDALRSLVRTTPAAQLDLLLGTARGPLGRLVPELDPDGTGVHDGAPAQLLDPVLGLLARLSATEPLLLVIEDLHWADRSTLELVALLARSLRGLRVALVATYRSDELQRAHPLRALAAGWERDRSVQTLALQRFTRAEVAGQLRAILGAPAEPDLVETVFERSEGNAFLVEEVLDAVRSGADPNFLPPSLRDVLLARVERLSDPAQRVLGTVSAGGRYVADALLATVAPLDEADLYGALREAVEHHLLVVDSGRGYAFRHVLARDAVYEDILPGERVRLHAAYGEALSAAPELAGGEAPAMLARHWYAAHDLPRALGASVEAGRATAGYAPAEAQRHYERALELWPQVADAEERCGLDHVELLRLAAEAAYHARNWERGVSLLDEALAQPGRVRVPLLVLRGTTLREWGRSDAAIATLRDAVAAVGPGDSGETRALALNVLAATYGRVGDMEQAEATVERALTAARGAGASLQEAQALATLGSVRAYWGRSPDEGLEALREARDIARRIGDQPLAVRVSINLSDVLTLQGRYAEAVEVAAAGRELTERTGMTRSLGVYLVANEAEALLQLGRWDEAEALLMGKGPAIAEFEARLALLRGRVDDAARAVQAAVRELGDRREPQERQAVAYVEAAVAHARGDATAARAIVARELTGDPAEALLRYEWPLIAIGLRVEADGTPDPERVGALEARADALPATTPHDRAQKALAAAEAARARAEPGAQEWAAAVGAAREAGEPHTLAYALLRAAEAGDKQTGPEGAGLAERLGAAPLAALARKVGAVPVGRADDGFGLTEREREVLALVAEGRSNTQVAQALFISPKTASVHVSNILAKLGVASRGEAAALAHRSGLI